MLVLCNGRLVTRDSKNPFIQNGAVAIDGKLIKDTGTTEELKARYPSAEVVDAKGGVIMPGMINVHNHTYSAFARGFSIKGNPPTNFSEILNQLWWTIDRHLLISDTIRCADATFIDCIENGVTTIIDHHASYGEIKGSLFALSERAKRYGLRVNLCYEVSDRAGQDQMKAAVKENVDFIHYARSDNSGLLAGMMGMHAPFTLSNKSLDYCVSQNPEGAGYHIHVAEGVVDVYDSFIQYGKRPVYRLYNFGILGAKTICGHCTHVNEAEIDVLKETNSMVTHNPESNMGNAVGCPPVLKMFERGVLIGLGTDGYTNDMIESYKVANILHKHHTSDPNAAWNEIPIMLFENNSKMCARFFDTPLGVLAPGAAADIIVCDYTPFTPMNATNINSHIMFGMNGRSVTTTIINGHIRMKDRQLINIDKEEVMAHCREQAQSLWKRINAKR